MMLKVSRYVTRSLSGSGHSVCLLLRVCLPERAGYMLGLCVVTSFVFRTSCSIPPFLLAHVLLIRRLVLGDKGISVSLFGRDIVMMCVVYSSAVSESRSTMCLISWEKCTCALEWSYAIARASCIFACERTSSSRIPIFWEQTREVLGRWRVFLSGI